MGWFERLTGFPERDYTDTRSKLAVEGDCLRSLVNGRTYGIGRFSTPSLRELRAAADTAPKPQGRLRASIVVGDVRKMHRDPANEGALFQVASQFNMLEMIGPSRTPEDGVSIYENDPTQGPACAIAAGAATIYRNYFAPVWDGVGQTAARQVDGLADVGDALASALGTSVDRLWNMRNGYALCTRTGLDAISGLLSRATPAEIDDLAGRLRVGLHSNVEVTDREAPGQFVSQVFCSALPASYVPGIPIAAWEPFARLVLKATYEATMLVTLLNAVNGGSKTVLLTSVGGGAFGNDRKWIADAQSRALSIMREYDLNVKFVCRDDPSREMRSLVKKFV